MRLAAKANFNDYSCFFYLFYVHHRTEANRDILDWSGKKPLDYQKQVTSTLSASTFSSEYKVMSNVIVSNIQTLPARQNTMKKNRNRERSNVQRSFTFMNDGSGSSARGSVDDTKSIDNFDTKSIISMAGASGFDTAPTKRKDKRYRSSFLKKSLSRKWSNFHYIVICRHLFLVSN